VVEHLPQFTDGSRPRLLREFPLTVHGFGEVSALSEILQVISLFLKAGGSKIQRLS